jgi:hypothetical protein
MRLQVHRITDIWKLEFNQRLETECRRLFTQKWTQKLHQDVL